MNKINHKASLTQQSTLSQENQIKHHKMKSKSTIESTNNGKNQTNNKSVLTKPRFPSYSSSSSSSSISSNSSFDYPPTAPSTPSHQIPTQGIPFSWESIPGIPKQQIQSSLSRNRNQIHNDLPLPPVFSKNRQHKLIPPTPSPSRRDPFFAALVECSKGGDDGGGWECVRKKGRRRLSSERGGWSCKSASAVVESLAFIPAVPRRIAYDVLKKSPS